VKPRPLEGKALPKIWGSTETEPWLPRPSEKIGEVWFTAPEEQRLLVKFLFTSENLSVQVHPPDSPAGPGKTEMWHLLRAAPGARLALGFKQRMDAGRLRQVAVSGEIEDLLCWHEARACDTFFVPAGTVHAIGAGLVLCEIQQHSDVTYRLYDYGRGRELHLEQALRVADLGPSAESSAPVDLGGGRRLLVECRYFRTESLGGTRAFLYPKVPVSEMIVCLEGRGRIDGQLFAPGEVWLAAGADAFVIEPREPVRLLRTYVP